MVGMASVARTSAVIASLTRVALAAVCGEGNGEGDVDVFCETRFGELCTTFEESGDDEGSNPPDELPLITVSEMAKEALLKECSDCQSAFEVFEPGTLGAECPAVLGAPPPRNEEECRKFQQDHGFEWTEPTNIQGTGVNPIDTAAFGLPCGCIINANLDVQGDILNVVPGKGAVMFVPDVIPGVGGCKTDFWNPDETNDRERFSPVCGKLPGILTCPARAARLYSEMPHLFSTMASTSIAAALAAVLLLFVIATRRRSVGNASLAVQMDEGPTDCQELTPHA
jgi:hypothetical protein